MDSVETSCWNWLGPLSGTGYGRIYPRRGKAKAYHRVVWEELNGPIDRKMDLHHLCENKRCYNPKHLMALGRAAHMFLHSGGFSWRGKTECRRGHVLVDENIRIRQLRGFPIRVCRVCENEDRAAWRKENREHCRKQLRDWRARQMK